MEEFKKLFVDLQREIKDGNAAIVAKIDSKVDAVTKVVESFGVKHELLEARVSAMDLDTKAELLIIKHEIQTLKNQGTGASGGSLAQADRLEKAAEAIDLMERRNNLFVRGLQETAGETRAQLMQLITNLLGVLNLADVLPIEASRKGPGLNRPVCLIYDARWKRDRVWSARFELRNIAGCENVFISADLTPKAQHENYLRRCAKRGETPVSQQSE
jgi:hypothetical protein